jgi:hypothetical protein
MRGFMRALSVLLSVLVMMVFFSGCTSHLVKATPPGPIQGDPHSAVLAFAVAGASENDITQLTIVDSDEKNYDIDLSYPSFITKEHANYYFIVLDPAKAYGVVGFSSRVRTYRMDSIQKHQIDAQPGFVDWLPTLTITRIDHRDISSSFDSSAPSVKKDIEELKALFPHHQFVTGFKK